MKWKNLAAVLLMAFCLLPGTVRADSRYTVALSQPQEIGVGKPVTVEVTISPGEGSYHAYDLLVAYDAEKLEFISCSQSGSAPQCWEEEGNLRIVGYGEAKNGNLELSFRTVAAGTTEVKLLGARVDERTGAPGRDAPEATLTNATATVTVTGEYPVTLDDGLTADSLTARAGEDFFFRAKETGNYTYAPTATVAGRSVTVHTDNEGAYYLSGTDIRGAVVITANRQAKSYTVQFIGDAGSGEKTATYNTDYVFTVTEKTGYTNTIKVTIGGENYSGYTKSGSKYTIPGTDITGAIVIKVTSAKTGSTSGSSGTTGSSGSGSSSGSSGTTASTTGGKTVTFLGSGASDAKGSAKTTANKDYTFTLNRKKGFTYTVTAKVGETTVPCTEDTEKALFTIPAKSVTGNLTITIVKEAVPEVSLYLTLDRRYLYLVRFDGELEKNQIPLYDGRTMVKTEAYGGYSYLVVSTQEIEALTQEAKLAMTLGTGETVEQAQYTGDVDRSGQRDRQDVTLVQQMYNAKYLLTDVEMLQFLNADLNGDGKLDIRDAAAAVSLQHQEDGT